MLAMMCGKWCAMRKCYKPILPSELRLLRVVFNYIVDIDCLPSQWFAICHCVSCALLSWRTDCARWVITSCVSDHHWPPPPRPPHCVWLRRVSWTRCLRHAPIRTGFESISNRVGTTWSFGARRANLKTVTDVVCLFFFLKKKINKSNKR